MGMGYYNDVSTISFSNLNGPVSITNAERNAGGKATKSPIITPASIPGSMGNFLTIPVILAASALIWYAIKKYE